MLELALSPAVVTDCLLSRLSLMEFFPRAFLKVASYAQLASDALEQSHSGSADAHVAL